MCQDDIAGGRTDARRWPGGTTESIESAYKSKAWNKASGSFREIKYRFGRKKKDLLDRHLENARPLFFSHPISAAACKREREA